MTGPAPTPPPTAVLYLRARSITAAGRNRASEEHAIDSQRRLCQEVADQLDATIVGEYIEHGGTGPLARRPVVRRLLADLRTLPGIRYVITASQDRLARRPTDLQSLTDGVTATTAVLITADSLPAAYYCNPDESQAGLTLTD